jgi:hypothetical protein
MIFLLVYMNIISKYINLSECQFLFPLTSFKHLRTAYAESLQCCVVFWCLTYKTSLWVTSLSKVYCKKIGLQAFFRGSVFCYNDIYDKNYLGRKWPFVLAPERHFVHHKSHMNWRGTESDLGRRRRPLSAVSMSRSCCTLNSLSSLNRFLNNLRHNKLIKMCLHASFHMHHSACSHGFAMHWLRVEWRESLHTLL